jgi:hypothetical protein
MAEQEVDIETTPAKSEWLAGNAFTQLVRPKQQGGSHSLQ